MELVGTVNQQNYPLKVEKLDDHYFRVTVEDRVYEIEAHQVAPNLFSLLKDNRSYEVRCLPATKKGQIEVDFHGQNVTLAISDPMALLLDSMSSGGRQGGATLEAAMPGKVQRILVKEGDKVTEDQGLLVLVAMKMENELGSPSSGTVKQILVREDDNVEGGAPLIIIE